MQVDRTAADGASAVSRARTAIPDLIVLDLTLPDHDGFEVLPILRSLAHYLPEVKVLYVEYHSERDRRLIDRILAETHVLWRGHVTFAYRGEFCYVKRDLVPDESETHTCEILMNPE